MVVAAYGQVAAEACAAAAAGPAAGPAVVTLRTQEALLQKSAVAPAAVCVHELQSGRGSGRHHCDVCEVVVVGVW